MKLGKQGFFFLVYMTVCMCMIHDLLIFARRDLKVTDGLADKFFKACGGFAWFVHRCSPCLEVIDFWQLTTGKATKFRAVSQLQAITGAAKYN